MRVTVLLLLTAALFPVSPASAAAPLCNGKVPTIVGTDGPDRLSGTGSSDVVWLGAGDDVFTSLFGSDLICGGSGNDLMSLGSGGDYIDGGSDLDRLTYLGSQEAASIDVGGHRTNYGTQLPDHHVNIEEFVGTEFDDTLVGTDAADSLHGRGGYDRIITKAGDDVITLSSGVVDAGSGDDDVLSSAEVQVVLGPGDDRIVGGPGASVVRGGPGSDLYRLAYNVLSGADLVPTFLGGPGKDFASFTDSAQPMRINLKTHSGNMHLYSVKVVKGGPFNDIMKGSAHKEMLLGQQGNDVLVGRGGDDSLLGGSGNDSATGGAGRDGCTAELRRSCEGSAFRWLPRSYASWA